MIWQSMCNWLFCFCRNDTLKALQQTFFKLGNSSINDDLQEIDVDLNAIKQLTNQMDEYLQQKKKFFQLTVQEKQEKRKRIDHYNLQRKQLEQKLNSSLNLSNDKQLKSTFFAEEKSNNCRLKQETQQLEKDFACLDNITKDQDLVRRIHEMNYEYGKLISVDESNPSSLSLSLSFDESYDQFH